MSNRKLKVFIIAFVTDAMFTYLVPTYWYRLPRVLNIKIFNTSLLRQLNDYTVHGTTPTSSKLSRHIDTNYTIVIFNPPLWLPVQSYNERLANMCEYNNCRLTTERDNLHASSAIIYYLTAAPALPLTPPIQPPDRNVNQVWIFSWLESPVNHIRNGSIYRNKHWKNTLNWTMTYTHDADVFFPYGALRKRQPPAKNYSQVFHRKHKMAAWVVSNCHTPSQREKYVEQLQHFGVNVDVFGGCAKKSVDSDSMRKEIESNYKFYLSFENSLCKDYITEKFFTYFNYDVLLVVRGGGNYSSLLPNGTYINTVDFGSVEKLANYLLQLGSSEEKYTNYLMNKDRFEAVYDDFNNESPCKLCEKLNKLEQNRRTYTNLLDIIHNDTCFTPHDISY